jgi:hypothetical protein
MLQISVAELVTNKKHLWQFTKKILIDKSLYTLGEYPRFTDVKVRTDDSNEIDSYHNFIYYF